MRVAAAAAMTTERSTRAATTVVSMYHTTKLARIPVGIVGDVEIRLSAHADFETDGWMDGWADTKGRIDQGVENRKICEKPSRS